MASIVDIKSKEEKDAELDRKIEALRKKNEALVQRHKLIEEDRRRAEQEGIAVTTPRKGKNTDAEPDKARKEKENFSITLDVNAGEKRVVNEGRSPKQTQDSPRSPTHRKSGRSGLSGRSPSNAQTEDSHQDEGNTSPSSTRPTRSRRSQGSDGLKREYGAELHWKSSRGNTDGSSGDRWTSSPRGGAACGDRGGRGPGRGGGTPARGGGTPGRGGVHTAVVDAPGPDRKVKEWEEKRRQNIEKMNEEMEQIAEYERSQRDGAREKNPIRNFLDDPRRTGPVADVDRKEGSRRHVRNWGGHDFEKVKTGLDREQESHVRRPAGRNQVDMTMSMTGRERAEYMRWKKEREQIDQERLERHRNQKGQWRREWDAEKNESMFKDDATVHIEDDPLSRRGKRGTPKPHTVGEILSESISVYKQKKDRRHGTERSKPYNQHDSRWEKPEDLTEKEVTAKREEKETCVEKVDNQKRQKKVEEPPKPATSAVKQELVEGDDEDDGEWTDASGDENEDESLEEEESEDENASTSPVSPQPAPKEQRHSPLQDTPKLKMPPPSESLQESNPTTPFSPEGHIAVTDWGEEMEQLCNEDSPSQTTTGLGLMKAWENDIPSDSGAGSAVQTSPESVVHEAQESNKNDGEADLEEMRPPAKCAEEVKPPESFSEEVKPPERCTEEVKPPERCTEEVKPTERCTEEVKPPARCAEEVKPTERCTEEVKPPARCAEEVKPHESFTEEVKPPERCAEEVPSDEVSQIPYAEDTEKSTANGGGINEKLSDLEEPKVAMVSLVPALEILVPLVDEPVSVVDKPVPAVESAVPPMAAPIAAVEQNAAFPPSS
ncbi:coiled-coil domain-containing protein 9 isoform X2 [Pelobates fuscus]|uniref:coiled-coil domain-containing protein 9 isoform X2 n=1 Tax=Pelobates fuscus TaxID=191477 RepID=UPI002FE44908